MIVWYKLSEHNSNDVICCRGCLPEIEYVVLSSWFDWIVANNNCNLDLIGTTLLSCLNQSLLFLTTEAALVVSVSFLSLSWISGKFVWFHLISSHFLVKSMSFGRYLKRTLLFLLLNYRRLTLCVLLFCLW